MATDEPDKDNQTLVPLDTSSTKLVRSSSPLVRRGLELLASVERENRVVLVLEHEFLMSAVLWEIFRNVARAYRARSLEDAWLFFSENHSTVVAVMGSGECFEFFELCRTLNPNVWVLMQCSYACEKLVAWCNSTSRARVLSATSLSYAYAVKVCAWGGFEQLSESTKAELSAGDAEILEASVSLGLDRQRVLTYLHNRLSFNALGSRLCRLYMLDRDEGIFLVITDNSQQHEFFESLISEFESLISRFRPATYSKRQQRCVVCTSVIEGTTAFLEHSDEVVAAILVEFSDPTKGDIFGLSNWLRAQDEELPILLLSTDPKLEWRIKERDPVIDEVAIGTSSWEIQVRLLRLGF